METLRRLHRFAQFVNRQNYTTTSEEWLREKPVYPLFRGVFFIILADHFLRSLRIRFAPVLFQNRVQTWK